MRAITSRPLTPHLTIYSSQYTSIYSIWHRITGVSLILIIVFYLTILKFFSLKLYSNLSIFFILKLWIKNTFYLNFSIFFIFHLLNGLRHIIWDLGYLLSIDLLLKSIKFMNVFLLLFIFNTIIKIFN